MTSAPTTFTVRSEDAMRRRAAAFAQQLAPGSLVALEGDLGAGKTVFVRGLAAGLAHDTDNVSSPSFVLAIEHRGGVRSLLHVDLYRLADGAGLDDLGIEEALARDWIVAVEWAQRLPGLLRRRAWRVSIVHATGQPETERVVTIFSPEHPLHVSSNEQSA
ncbi:MAG: tRNA (adenosine(37)-N6)-threonylcarbamoyltransferase complex ATPase subunit type 1 TsaE [Acidobacteriota bacterium]